MLSVKEALGYFGPKMFGMKKDPSDELIDGFKEGGTGFTLLGGFQFAHQRQEEKKPYLQCEQQ